MFFVETEAIKEIEGIIPDQINPIPDTLKVHEVFFLGYFIYFFLAILFIKKIKYTIYTFQEE